MKRGEQIQHTGIVHSISGKIVTVKVLAHPACSSCHASGICGSAGSVEKLFSFPTDTEVTEGQRVVVTTSLTTGFRALLFGYLVPFLALLVTIILLTLAGASELVAGLTALVSVALYYLVLYLLRNRIGKRIVFNLIPE